MLSISRTAVLCFMLAIALPIIISTMLLDSESISVSVAIAIFAFAVTALTGAIYLNHLIQQNLILQKQNQQLVAEAGHAQLDPLTHLPNRQSLQAELEQCLSRSDQNLMVAYIDIMRFRLFNERVDPQLGNLLLQQLAERLRQHIASARIIARIGADEFAFILPEIAGVEQAKAAVQPILAELNEPFEIEQKIYHLEVCAGISLYPLDSNNAATLLHQANQALQWAKRKSLSGYYLYQEQRLNEVNGQFAPEQSLKRALDNNELCLYYQPQIDLFNNAVFGFEALLRWNHPRQGLLSAEKIIPLAEQTGLIDPIGRYILKLACQQAQEWNKNTHYEVSVNISAQQFLQADFAAQVEQELLASNLNPSALKLEITESLLLPESKRIQRMLQHLQALGVKIAVDDFGVDYASFNYLKQFPLDWIKIDRSFIKDVATNPNDAAIVNAIISLAHSLGLQVLPEGIEDETQLAFITRRHSDAAQGFYFAPPMANEELKKWLRNPRLPDLPVTSKQRSILIVEDDYVQRELMAMWLRQAQYQVELAEDAKQAFAVMARQSIDLMLVDYGLPQTDGVEFMRRVRSIYNKTVRLLISAQADEAALTRAINEGGVARFLAKPVSQEQLCDTVREVLSQQNY